MTQSLGRALGIAVLDRKSVPAEVLFGLLDAGEDLVEESLVLGLLAVFQNRGQTRQSSRAGQATAGPAARKGAVGRLDGFMAEAV